MIRALLLALLPVAAQADTFHVRFGASEIGIVSLDGGRIASRFSGTPFGIADGTFEAATDGTRYVSASRFSRGDRDVEIAFAGGRVEAASVVPAEDVTALTDPANVPDGVIDPVTAFDRLVHAQGCPAGFRLYEGRRVTEVAVAEVPGEAGRLECRGTYRVVLGPPHLEPLDLSLFRLTLRYDLSAGSQALASIEVGTLLFSVELVR